MILHNFHNSVSVWPGIESDALDGVDMLWVEAETELVDASSDLMASKGQRHVLCTMQSWKKAHFVESDLFLAPER